MRKRILIAEDDTTFSLMLTSGLQLGGFEVVAVSNGRDAIAQLEHTPFDLLILDCVMPQASGIEVCEAVRNRLQLNEVPIIFCTAKGMELDSDELRERFQVTKIFHKPASLRAVVAYAREVTSKTSRPAPSGFAGAI